MLELYIEFEYIVADRVQHDLDKEDDKVEVFRGMNNDSKDDFEANYEVNDENEHGDKISDAVVQNAVVPHVVSQFLDVLPFMCILDLDTMHIPEFSKCVNIGT
ncbi:hypothetical protein AHAS_Ahas10G0068700 [Arachis hypogaea]